MAPTKTVSAIFVFTLLLRRKHCAGVCFSFFWYFSFFSQEKKEKYTHANEVTG